MRIDEVGGPTINGSQAADRMDAVQMPSDYWRYGPGFVKCSQGP
jgi:hypothetical protein